MTGLSMVVTASAATLSKGRRMASVLDTVLKPLKVSPPASSKVSKDKLKNWAKLLLQALLLPALRPDLQRLSPWLK